MPDLRTFVLAARKVLIREAEEQLVQLYGLKPTGVFLAESEVAALRRLDGAMETRKKLKQLLADEQEAGIAPVAAINKLTKEVAFTHLNRLVALKLLEGRGLTRGAVNKWHNSNGFLFYRADVPEDQKLFEQGSQPTDDRGEGPSDLAYRHFLLWQYGKLAEEIRVLFDPDNLASALFPRPLVLRSLVDQLNSDDLKEYWAPGNEETVGWVYQFFNADEKAEAFARVFKKKQKFQKEDIPAATQIFTPRWIVEYLVQNSLGRLWVNMHPDSLLAEDLPYLIPMSAAPPRPVMKLVKNIRLLDPASGTMHFGLVAFDLLVKMYREELQKAGAPGWPADVSVKSEEEIAASILANNLFGIDIDLRAVQLSALALYLRAKQTNKNAKLSDSRLACADVAIFGGQHLARIAGEMALPQGVTRELFLQFCRSVDEASQMGSLVRLEQHFRNFEANRLRDVIDQYVAERTAAGQDESYFGQESSKGLRLLDLMTQRYDVVFANPPYMSNRNMNPRMAEFMKANYKKSKSDLYSAFIERCAELLNDGGRLAMITQQSFMFISRFEELREVLLHNTVIENMVHTGPRAFAEVSGEKVNTTAYVLRREALSHRTGDETATYFRLVKEPDAESKQAGFEQSLERRRRDENDGRVYEYRQSDFAAIPGYAWVYWITAGLRDVFRKCPGLGSVAKPGVGQNTGDNLRFLRYWWEPGVDRVDRSQTGIDSAAKSDKKWFPYMKGGSFKRWYGNQERVLNWSHNGGEVKEYAVFRNHGKHWSRYLQNLSLMFQRGVTWTDLTTGKFNARLSPGGFMFDVSGSSVFPPDVEMILGVMNSSWANYALNLINPTAHVQVGDLSRLPIPKAPGGPLNALVERAVSLAKKDSDESETTYDFVAPPGWLDGGAHVVQRHRELELLERDIDEEVYRLYAISDADRKAIEDELAGPVEVVDVEAEECVDGIEPDEESDSDRQLSQEALAKQWVSYSVGIALGRFVPGRRGALGPGGFSIETADRLRKLASADGLLLLENGHPDDLAQRVLEILRIALGDEAADAIVRLATGPGGDLRESLEAHLLGAFFKEHVRQYRKRPVYWLLQSPNRAFSVYLFHERATANTLSTLQGNRYLGGQIHRLETELMDLQRRAATLDGKESTRLKSRAQEIAETLEDLKAFDAHLHKTNQVPIMGSDGRVKTIHWEPEFDDGVLLNAAPLHELVPAWKRADAKLDLKRVWKELEDGKYDWAKTAMRYWPGRVLNACKTNQSFAIAHGLA